MDSLAEFKGEVRRLAEDAELGVILGTDLIIVLREGKSVCAVVSARNLEGADIKALAATRFQNAQSCMKALING